MKVIDGAHNKEFFKIALVVSRYRDEFAKRLYDAALARLKELGFQEHLITVVWSPSALELPLLAQRLARTDAYEAIVCLGAVIRGETDRYDYVCAQASQGCQKVALENDIPVVFGVLTTDNEAQAKARSGGLYGNIGEEAINAAVETVVALRMIS